MPFPLKAGCCAARSWRFDAEESQETNRFTTQDPPVIVDNAQAGATV
jgi:hypothetical protein